MHTKLNLALNALSETYGAKTKLFALPKTEFDTTDTLIGAVLCAAGHDERPRQLINAFHWWGISVEEFGEILQSDRAFLDSNP